MSSWVKIILRHKVVIMGDDLNKGKLDGHMQNTKESGYRKVKLCSEVTEADMFAFKEHGTQTAHA